MLLAYAVKIHLFILYVSVLFRFWTATCPHLWSPHCPLRQSCLSQSSQHLSSFQQPAALATAYASVVCPTLLALKISWSSWESTLLTSNPTESTWSSTNRSAYWKVMGPGILEILKLNILILSLKITAIQHFHLHLHRKSLKMRKSFLSLLGKCYQNKTKFKKKKTWEGQYLRVQNSSMYC